MSAILFPVGEVTLDHADKDVQALVGALLRFGQFQQTRIQVANALIVALGQVLEQTSCPQKKFAELSNLR
ncbi:MAG: hypothetical protein HYX74_04410 [Acidobacteria bacterium]|nr:hypothetical protein [Acidobacteriota bacterium]